MELVILVGLQGSGKSTFYARRFQESHLCVSLDVVRTRRREQAIVKAALEVGQRLVIDNTNPACEDRARYISWAKEARFRVLGYYFNSQLEPCLARNKLRAARKVVPEKGVLATYKRLELPALDEGFDQLYYVSQANNDFIVEDWSTEEEHRYHSSMCRIDDRMRPRR